MFIEEDPYHPTTIGGWIRAFALAKTVKAELGDQASIEAEIEQEHAAEKQEAEAFWAQMEADGVPVAAVEPEPEAVPDADPEPEAEASL